MIFNQLIHHPYKFQFLYILHVLINPACHQAQLFAVVSRFNLNRRTHFMVANRIMSLTWLIMAGPGSLTGYSMVVDLEFLQVEHQEVDTLEGVEYFFANLDIDYDNSISAFVEEDLAQCASKNVVEKLMNERSFVVSDND